MLRRCQDQTYGESQRRTLNLTMTLEQATPPVPKTVWDRICFMGRSLGQQKHQHDAPANERQRIEELPIAGPAEVMQPACCHRDERDQQNQMRESQNAANPRLGA